MVNMEWLQTMERWIPELQGTIPAALEAVTRGRDDIVSVGLFTDSDAGTLQAAALSRGRWDEIQAQGSEHTVLYAWDPDEWDLFAGNQRNELDSVMAKVRSLAAEVPESQWESFLLLAYNVIVEAMRKLYADGFFDTAYPKANVAFWVTDTKVHRENLIEWMTLFNPPERVAPYVQYLRTTY